MGKTGTVKHIHQYYRRNNGLWHCSGIDECTHYVPKNMPEPVGRRSICWGCAEPFQLTPVNMIPEKPMCDTCMDKINILDKYLEDKLKNIAKPTGLAAFGAKKKERDKPVSEEPGICEHVWNDSNMCLQCGISFNEKDE